MKARKKTGIVIVGGGFAGLYAAKDLDRYAGSANGLEVTLISRENLILFTPMLHEVAAGDLSPGDIVNPLRRILRRVNVVAAEVQAIDLTTRTVRCLNALQDMELTFQFDHLLLALGAETNFFDTPGARDWAVTMKNLADAALLRNRMVPFWKKPLYARMSQIGGSYSPLSLPGRFLRQRKQPERLTTFCATRRALSGASAGHDPHGPHSRRRTSIT